MAQGDAVALAAFRVDGDELLDGAGTSVSEVMVAAVEARGRGAMGCSGAHSRPRWSRARRRTPTSPVTMQDAGADLLLDARTRRGGSHHQKLVVATHPGDRSRDVAFVGGIDIARSRNDDSDHLGDPQPMDFPAVYGPRPPWHDVQLEVQGPAVSDLALTFRERWEGSTLLDLPSPLRMLWDRTYHAGAMTGGDLPEALPDPPAAGPHTVQVLRTYPARWRRYPFAPLGERSIAAAYSKVLRRAHRLIYIEDQYLWAPGIARLLCRALRADPGLHLVAVVPRWPDKSGQAAMPSLLGRERAIDLCRTAGGDRFAIYDVENREGIPVYVHAKVVIVDDVWAMVGSDNLNRRSWTHDSELSCAVLDETRDEREPRRPGRPGRRRPRLRPRPAARAVARAPRPGRATARRTPASWCRRRPSPRWRRLPGRWTSGTSAAARARAHRDGCGPTYPSGSPGVPSCGPFRCPASCTTRTDARGATGCCADPDRPRCRHAPIGAGTCAWSPWNGC